MLIDLGCDPEKVYFDVPRMRTWTAQGYLTTGIAYAFHPHRDTWYSAPFCQLNWWLPIYPISVDNGLAFHPRYWYTPRQEQFEGVQLRRVECHQPEDCRKPDRYRHRVQPKPEEELELDAQIRPLCEPGGIILFSGSQLHSSVPNTSTKTRVQHRSAHRPH
jgi:ectoine hydroxylase-related dioxygenase (phytanoyl-CoA dioxygenase family)